MLDFTSALYLGMRHPSSSLRPWRSLTEGVPAVLGRAPDAGRIAHEIAALQGCERGTLGTSTLHLFWDLFGIAGGGRVRILFDEGLYPIARWGVERAASKGAAALSFRHHEPEALQRLLRESPGRGARPLVVTDGFCPGCGRAAPLAAYLERLRPHGGTLILDDTQSLGIFGHSPGPAAPYGRGGGGMLPAGNLHGPDVLAISSLAKGFGAPLAVMTGSKKAVEEFERRSETRTHCSPPSAAAIRAAEHALAVNRAAGDRLRLRLARLVMRFRARAARAGLQFREGIFPVQTLVSTPETDVAGLHRHLLRLGIRTVPHWAREGRNARLSFIVTASHTPEEIDRAALALAEADQHTRRVWA